MSEKMSSKQQEPLGKELTYLSRLYYGVVTNKLSSMEIERYYYVLVLIEEGEGKITQKELSEKIRSDKVFTVKILDYLSEKGMIKRLVNNKDRREHFISLTPKGKKLVPDIAKAFHEANEAALNGLTKQEQEIFFKAMNSMRENLLLMPADEMKINFKKIKKNKNGKV